jgi:hypothetical protein
MAVCWRLQRRGGPRRYPFHRKRIGDDCTCGVLTAEDLAVEDGEPTVEQRRDNLSQSMPTTVWQMNVLFAVRGVSWGSTALRGSLAPLSSGAREWACFVGEQGSVDDVGESTLEDAKGFSAAVATVLTAIEQFTSWLVTPGLSQGDAV